MKLKHALKSVTWKDIRKWLLYISISDDRPASLYEASQLHI